MTGGEEKEVLTYYKLHYTLRYDIPLSRITRRMRLIRGLRRSRTAFLRATVFFCESVRGWLGRVFLDTLLHPRLVTGDSGPLEISLVQRMCLNMARRSRRLPHATPQLASSTCPLQHWQGFPWV